MKINRVVIGCAIAAALSGNAFAQLSAQYTDWAKGPVQYIMTADEAAKWKQIKNDQDAKAFVDLFWARRDPSPATPQVNEYKDRFDARVAAADSNFFTPKKKGWQTERGKYLIILGKPTKIQSIKGDNLGTTQSATDRYNGELTNGQAQGYSPKQLWSYERGKSDFDPGIPVAEFAFVDQYGTNDWTLERKTGTDVKAIADRAIAQSIVSPNLTEAPKAKPAAAPTPVAQPLPTTPAAAANAIGEIKTESLRSAIAAFKAASTNPYKSAFVTYTELVSPNGDAYIPVQLFIPKSAGLTAESMTTFFGVIEDASGTAVSMFEEPATISTSNGDLYFDKSIHVKPGAYKATLGLSGADGKPVVMASGDMTVQDFNKDSFGISRMVVSNDMHETEAAAVTGSPYAFGRLKIVPKGDKVFSNKDEISYFIEVFNPTIDAATSLPKLQVKVELVGGKGPDGKPMSIGAPLSDASSLPLSGSTGAGQYAIISSIPLGMMKKTLPPGDYTLRVKVYDQAKGNTTWTAEQKLKLADIPPAQPVAPAAAAPAK